MEHSPRKIHLCIDVLLETFKFLLKNDLRKCQKVAPQWNLVIQRNKHMLCKISQMQKTLFAAIRCLKRKQSPDDYRQFQKSIRELLLNDEKINRKKLIEEFAVVDDSCFLFDLVSEGIADFRATNKIGTAHVFMAAKILYCLSSEELLNQLEINNKKAYKTELAKHYKKSIPKLLQRTCDYFETKKSKMSEEEVSCGVMIFCAEMRLGMLFRIREMNIFMIANSALPCISVDKMSNYLYHILCKTLYEMTEYDEVFIAVRHFINELEEFAQDDQLRINKIKELRDRVPQQ